MKQIPLLTPLRTILFAVALASSIATASSQGLPVTYVGPDDDLQAALDHARPGEQILLQPGAVYLGNFILPAVASSATAWVSLSSAGPVPDWGQRVTPEWAGQLPILQSPNSRPALATAPAAHHWIVIGLEFQANNDGYGDIIQLGDGSKGQSSADQVPHDLILDRLYIHGDPLRGQKRGISMNSAATQVMNSWISDIKAIGMDTQAIGSWNGPGPFQIVNNYLEAAGENLMFGGADPFIKNLVATGVDVRQNTFAKPVEWKNGILPVPANVQATGATLGGTLRTGSYSYRIVAEREAGQQIIARSAGSTSVSVTMGRGVTTGSANITWDAVDTAESYRVYRHGGGPDMWWRTTGTQFQDAGATDGTQGAVPAQPVAWQVKNLFELKNATQVRVDGNRFRGNWVAAQPGYAIVLTPRNQDGAAAWAKVQDVTFTNNIIESVAGGFNISGADDTKQSDKAKNIVIRNNLLIDVDGTKWGGNGDFVQVGHGPDSVTIDHNTVVHTGRMLSAYGQVEGKPEPITQFVFRNNVLQHNQYGVIGTDFGIGNSTLGAYFPSAVFAGNVIAGGNPAQYPSNNSFTDVDTFKRLFNDPASGDYGFADGAPFIGAGNDGLTPGVDMATLSAAMSNGVPPSDDGTPPDPRGKFQDQ